MTTCSNVNRTSLSSPNARTLLKDSTVNSQIPTICSKQNEVKIWEKGKRWSLLLVRVWKIYKSSKQKRHWKRCRSWMGMMMRIIIRSLRLMRERILLMSECFWIRLISLVRIDWEVGMIRMWISRILRRIIWQIILPIRDLILVSKSNLISLRNSLNTFYNRNNNYKKSQSQLPL